LARAVRLLPYQRRWVEDDSKLKIAVKARQIGYSFAATLRAVLKCLEQKTTWIFLSKGERQSRLLMEKVQEHVRACGIAARAAESNFLEGTSLKQLEVRFPNGSVIYGLPANPDTARGYSGHVTLDEFAFHADADKIYTALFPTITRGYGLEVISTPNGTQGKFYELAKAAGLTDPGLTTRDSGFAKKSASGPESRAPNPEPPAATWSAHYCDIYDAVRAGLKIDLALLRSGCEDAAAWQQEFCCQFVSTAENFFPPDLLAACLSAEATTECDLRQPASLTGFGAASAPRSSEGSRQTARQRTDSRQQSTDSGPLPAGERGPALSGTGEGAPLAIPDFQIPTPEFFLGIDIGRRHDRTVLWVDEVQRLEPQKLETRNRKLENWNSVPEVGAHADEVLVSNFQFPVSSFSSSITNHNSQITNLSVTRMVRVMDNAPFAEQLAAARELLRLEDANGQPLIRRCAIDATGIGAMLAETLAREFGSRVEPVVFTAAVKEDLAFRTKRRMEARLSLVPDTREIRRAFSAVKKYITPAGNLRFDAARTEAGHADEFWAKALADLAADPEARRATAYATDAFLADAVPIVSPLAFQELEAAWPTLELM
jgi:phage FluMu gp28-like protein